MKIKKKIKKTSRWTVSMNKCAEFSADLNMFRNRNESTFVFGTESQSHGLTNIFFIGQFVVQKV